MLQLQCGQVLGSRNMSWKREQQVEKQFRKTEEERNRAGSSKTKPLCFKYSCCRGQFNESHAVLVLLEQLSPICL